LDIDKYDAINGQKDVFVISVQDDQIYVPANGSILPTQTLGISLFVIPQGPGSAVAEYAHERIASFVPKPAQCLISNQVGFAPKTSLFYDRDICDAGGNIIAHHITWSPREPISLEQFQKLAECQDLE